MTRKPGAVADDLRTTNPWWRRGDWIHHDPVLVEVARAPFDYRPEPLAGIEEGGLYVLRGPRRVGKSVELHRLAASLLDGGVSPSRVILASLDRYDARDLRILVRTGREVLTGAEPESRYWLIDEITAVGGDWAAELKWLRDNDPGFRLDTVVLTGSSAHDIDSSMKSLAGRRRPALNPDRTLLPMGFGDFCRAIGMHDLPIPEAPVRVSELPATSTASAAQALAPWLNELRTAWERYLEVGGFPQAVTDHLGRRDPRPFAEAIWEVIHGDAFRRADFSPGRTRTLLALLTENLGSPVSLQRFAEDIGVDQKTVAARLDDLARAYLAWPCPQESDLTPKRRTQSKWYFIDPLLARLAQLRGDRAGPELTALSEQQIGLAIARSLERREPGHWTDFNRVLYHRTVTRREIDFVGPDFQNVAVESKYVEGTSGRDRQTLRASPFHGVLATANTLELQGDVQEFPAPMLALLLEHPARH